MSWCDGPFPEMEQHLGRPDNRDPLALDDGTADRLLRGAVAVDDAPPSYRGVVAVLTALTAGTGERELSGERQAVASIARRIAQNAASSPNTRRTKMPIKRRFRVAGVTLVGTAALLSGLGAAGALPGAAQSVASDMLNTVGVSVPNPNTHSNGHADQRGRSGGASDNADPADATTQGTDKGATVSGLATDPSTTGVDKGAAVSSEASNGESQAGENTPAGASADPSSAAPVETPNPGGTGTANGASDGQSNIGTGTADGVSDGKSDAGSGNTNDGLTHNP